MKKQTFSLAGILVTMFAARSEAAREAPDAESKEPKTFGEAGEVALSGNTQLDITHRSLSSPSSAPSQSITNVVVAPSVDFFVVRGLSLGGGVAYSGSYVSGSPFVETVSIGPRVGYDVPLGKQFSLWPTVSAAYSVSWASGSRTGAVVASTYAPVLAHLASHFFVGFGPTVSFDTTLAPRNSSTSFRDFLYGVSLTLGGWV